eukprot:TRINITY_DN9532_c0_g1_i1.p1 TRINITY_DN9532_c0_g1~~TRINITY_DN9532_c0_g1_i1.p1  ORF type:complete len:261 (-),score=37.87 TRINITY_DN9532_c0_g1_i1:60-842(-)
MVCLRAQIGLLQSTGQSPNKCLGQSPNVLLALAQCRLADCLRASGDWSEAEQHALEAERLSRGDEEISGLVRARALLAVAICQLRSDREHALTSAKQAADLMEPLHSWHPLAGQVQLCIGAGLRSHSHAKAVAVSSSSTGKGVLSGAVDALCAARRVLSQCYGSWHPYAVEARWRCGDKLENGSSSCGRVATVLRSVRGCTRESPVPASVLRRGHGGQERSHCHDKGSGEYRNVLPAQVAVLMAEDRACLLYTSPSPRDS